MFPSHDLSEWECEIGATDVETLRECYRIVSPACKQACPSEVVTAALYALRSRTAARKEDAADLENKALTYATELEKYPPDVVVEGCKSIARKQKFFPALAEIITELESLMQKRRAILAAIERAGRRVEPRPVTVDRPDTDDPVWQEWMKGFLAGNHVTFEEYKQTAC